MMRALHASRIVAMLSAVVTVGASCARVTPAVALPPNADAAAMEAVAAAMDHYVALLRRVTSDSVAAMYTPDGELLEPGMAPLRGRSAIRAFLAPFDGHAVVDTALVSVEPAAVYGAIAYQWGAYHQVARLNGGPAVVFDGRFAAEWHRAGNGQWLLTRLLMQPAPPVPRSSQ